MKTVKEMGNKELLQTTLEVYARACNLSCTKEMHERAMELKAELSNRLESLNVSKIAEDEFNVFTITEHNEDDGQPYQHWSYNLKMIIKKNGTTIKLNSDEIQKLVKSLPRTVGRTY